jgi:soluble lytic murein transglycosylase
LLEQLHFLNLFPVKFSTRESSSITQIAVFTVKLLCLLALASPPAMAQDSLDQQREAFSRAWRAAGQGDRASFHQLKSGLQDYVLYPYLQYEDLRHRRGSVQDQVMSDFLDAHGDWAFAAGLRTAWLKTLGDNHRWGSLLLHAPGSKDTVVRCRLARAKIERGRTEGLLSEAKKLWAVGKSQPDECDPVFTWLKGQGGITPGLAWERIRLAMEARQPRLTLYLARFIPPQDRVWVERWQDQDRGRYRRLDRAKQWGDVEFARVISDYGLRRLARSDPDRAARIYADLQSRFSWSEAVRGGILREIALWSAVERSADTAQRMRAVPEEFLDEKLLEWWARHDLANARWADLILTISNMPPELKNDARWRYWDARARMEMGDPDYAGELLGELATQASYYGFMSADYLGLPYTICPAQPTTTPAGVERLRSQPGFERSLELRRAGIRNWSRSEWRLATQGLDRGGLRHAAALAIEENWPDMAIFALGNSGDLRWYEWRFPVEYSDQIGKQTQKKNLDRSWVMGLMRSESAMAEDAISSAGARGLMQVMPDTAKQLARRHSLNYTGRSQLLQASDNILFGTTYLRELLDRYGDNPVLVSGAYNAGPGAVDRWLDERVVDDPAIWVETLPYYETRDYIPRVLAFSTIYDWRLQQPVTRISSRMLPLDSGKLSPVTKAAETTEVVCQAPG